MVIIENKINDKLHVFLEDHIWFLKIVYK